MNPISKSFVQCDLDFENWEQRLQAIVDDENEECHCVYWDVVDRVPIFEKSNGTFYKGVGTNFTYEEVLDYFLTKGKWGFEYINFHAYGEDFDIQNLVENDSTCQIIIHHYQ